jgi:hypothetical protein
MSVFAGTLAVLIEVYSGFCQSIRILLLSAKETDLAVVAKDKVELLDVMTSNQCIPVKNKLGCSAVCLISSCVLCD